jgi:pimeloyl-ACP methyl ester carboxylesterase
VPVPLVLVHGNPEAAVIWDPMVARIGRRDVIRLSLPGFGAPIPEGFECTLVGYRDWLADELESIDGPVDIVGHDVGGSTTIALAMSRPDLLRSWTSDSVGVFDPAYQWHDLARGWQTPGVGERSAAEWTAGDLSQRLALAQGLGATGHVADGIAAALGEDMGRAILQFYRSVAQPALALFGRDLELAAARPGLTLIPLDDTFVGTVEGRLASARRAGATVAEMPGLGHRWMLDDPATCADILTRFWGGLPE